MTRLLRFHRESAPFVPRGSLFKKLPKYLLISVALSSVALAKSGEKVTPDLSLALIDAKVIGADGSSRTTSLAIGGGKIVAMGDRLEIEKLMNKSTRVINLQGMTLTPGFVEAHGHLMELGMSLKQADLAGSKSKSQALVMVKKALSQRSDNDEIQWVLGRGWDHTTWPKVLYPRASDLDELKSERPIALTSRDGHAMWVNSAALKAAGIEHDIKDPKGGLILRDEAGQPTGVFLDEAISLIQEHIPTGEFAHKLFAVREALQYAATLGLTAFHDVGIGEDVIQILKELSALDRLPIRVYGMLDGSDSALCERYFKQGPIIDPKGFLDVRAIAIDADGELLSRKAYLTNSYDDQEGTKGSELASESQLFGIALTAIQTGFQVNVSAHGDLAVAQALNAFEKATKVSGIEATPRFRIERGQLIRPIDAPRFKNLGVIASIQPIDAPASMPWITQRLGKERTKSAYAWQMLAKEDVTLISGSDTPRQNLNPLWGFYAAITRRDHANKPQGGWLPEHRLTRAQALASYTSNSAYGSFREQRSGKVALGFDADLSVWSQNIMEIKPKALLKTRAVMTIVQGRIVHNVMDVAKN
jgi:predicted amidohydrolase YtcJ